MNNDLSRDGTHPTCSLWSSFLTVGIFLVLLGSLALSSAFITTIATVFFFGVVLFAGGISYILHALWTKEWKNFFTQFFIGTLAAISGWLMVTNPQIGAASLTLLLSLFFLASGVFRIVDAVSHQTQYRGWLILNGLVTFILGLLIFLQWPTSSLWIIGLFIGIDLIFGGWTNIMYGLLQRKQCLIETTNPV